jgi:hypothetical protein
MGFIRLLRCNLLLVVIPRCLSDGKLRVNIRVDEYLWKGLSLTCKTITNIKNIGSGRTRICDRARCGLSMISKTSITMLKSLP